MKKIVLTLCLFGGFFCASDKTAASPAERQLDKFGETNMEMSEGLFFVMGKVKGSRVGYFLVDLGASHTIVKRSVVDKGKSDDSALVTNDNIPEMLGLRGKVKNITGWTTLEHFKTGTINFGQIPALVVDSLYDFGGKDVLGIIGLDLLARAPCLRISISGGRKAKYKLEMGNCSDIDDFAPMADSFIIADKLIIMPGMVNGQPLSFILDTGSKHALITREAARNGNIVLDSNYLIVYQGLDEHPDTAITGHASHIYLGKTRIDRVGLYIGNIPQVQGESFITDGIIGTDLLTRFRSLEIDFEKHQYRLMQ